ncbi:MAG TPA: hypothetical protein VJ816_03195 [Gemmatimonadales bacterium]|nr:hypothetical protein [Gemmatimonadales bacterium]
MTPDPSFVKDLQAYDAKLRVRWGRHTERWIIERKVPDRDPAWRAERPINPFGTNKRAKDLWAGWREGYVCVMLVHPSLLNWRTVAPELAASDSQHAGSWEALADRMDAADAAMEAERMRTVTNWSESASKAGADHLFWQQKHTIAVTQPTPYEARHPDGFIVRTRRSQP